MKTQIFNNRWMDKEVVVYLHYGILCSYKNRWNLVVGYNLVENGRYYVKQSESEAEEQIEDELTHLWYTETQEQK